MITIALLFLAGLSYYMNLPLLSGPDEPVHVNYELYQFEQYQQTSGWLLFALAVLCMLLGGIQSILILSGGSLNTQPFWGLRDKKNIILFIGAIVLLFILFYLLHEVLDLAAKELGYEKRWPPVGTILASVSFSILEKVN